MDFTDVINDLIKMEGLRLNSIRPGAEIVIENVDVEQNKITIRNKSGRIQNRYFAEMQRIWDALLSNPMIRVEDILNGSGSSRNQPETIFANLPYVEWLKVDNKKHITYVGKATHSYGTLRQMDFTDANSLCDKLVRRELPNDPMILVVSEDVALTAKKIRDILGVAPIAIREGFYEFSVNAARIVLTRSEDIKLPCGTYCEVRHTVVGKWNCTVNLAGKSYGVCRMEEFNAIVPL